MLNKREKVVLFPKWKETLEEESLIALKEKRYHEALSKLDKLISYNINTHEIVIGKLICLMELDRYEDAQELCEELMADKDENYYHYVHIYLTILFQTSQYSMLMEQVEFEFEQSGIPEMIREQFQQLYEMSKKMKHELRTEKSVEYIEELMQAVKNENHLHQWRIIEELRKVEAVPVPSVKKLLVNGGIHPVVKTAIFNWFQEMNVSEEIEVKKFDFYMSVIPTSVAKIDAHPAMKRTMLLINDLEQNNPSLYKLVETLLYRYCYVRYPVMPDGEEIIMLADALKIIGESNMEIHTDYVAENDGQLMQMMEEIKLCEALYLSIIEA
ncbi:tetratricopeptide repeat protein [Virgibacillus siamensis]|uniref:tetratricopeptide repeat protein n=1 Tax=Virgibacillus siamensis TaxID=480071 RepID=UPI0009872807|nr:tetratricopeptide repeat protein [Virgibacillus siamensis]